MGGGRAGQGRASRRGGAVTTQIGRAGGDEGVNGRGQRGINEKTIKGRYDIEIIFVEKDMSDSTSTSTADPKLVLSTAPTLCHVRVCHKNGPQTQTPRTKTAQKSRLSCCACAGPAPTDLTPAVEAGCQHTRDQGPPQIPYPEPR